jgi:hypothetical protein
MVCSSNSSRAGSANENYAREERLDK